MVCPPFEMFAWKRVVTDEFTYLDARDMAVVRNLTASYKWCLSGTPPTGSFQDIKGMASLLGIYLGVDEAQAIASDSKEFKALQKDMTPSEKFQVMFIYNLLAQMHSYFIKLFKHYETLVPLSNIVGFITNCAV